MVCVSLVPGREEAATQGAVGSGSVLGDAGGSDRVHRTPGKSTRSLQPLSPLGTEPGLVERPPLWLSFLASEAAPVSEPARTRLRAMGVGAGVGAAKRTGAPQGAHLPTSLRVWGGAGSAALGQLEPQAAAPQLVRLSFGCGPVFLFLPAGWGDHSEVPWSGGLAFPEAWLLAALAL